MFDQGGTSLVAAYDYAGRPEARAFRFREGAVLGDDSVAAGEHRPATTHRMIIDRQMTER